MASPMSQIDTGSRPYTRQSSNCSVRFNEPGGECIDGGVQKSTNGPLTIPKRGKMTHLTAVTHSVRLFLLWTALVKRVSGGGVSRHIVRLRIQAQLETLCLAEFGTQLFRGGRGSLLCVGKLALTGCHHPDRLLDLAIGLQLVRVGLHLVVELQSGVDLLFCGSPRIAVWRNRIPIAQPSPIAITLALSPRITMGPSS